MQKSTPEAVINTQIYSDLGERWYTASDDPVALLRAESKLRGPWVLAEIEKRLGPGPHKILDIGCGAGFLTNYLASTGMTVTGLDLSAESLEVARRYDKSTQAQYLSGDIFKTDFAPAAYDICCAMDFLEHVEDVPGVVKIISQLLRPGGIFFFHTFNRNPLSWLIAIKGVEWFVKNTPCDLHLYRMFIKPAELQKYCGENEIQVVDLRGMPPKVLTKSFWKLLRTRQVPQDFEFQYTKSLWIGYSGIGIKKT